MKFKEEDTDRNARRTSVTEPELQKTFSQRTWIWILGKRVSADIEDEATKNDKDLRTEATTWW